MDDKKLAEAIKRQKEKQNDETAIEEIKKEVRKAKDTILNLNGFLHTGSTLLNLACSGNYNGGLKPGHYYLIVGDSDSGKSILSHAFLAEACLDDTFVNYRLIYDDVEYGSLMDIEKLYGSSLLERMEPPAGTQGDPIFSSTIEDFFYNLDDAFNQETPFIYVLDSQDSLTSDSEKEKFSEEKKAYRKGKEIAGSYGDGKAKQYSKNLRQCLHKLQKSNSILIIINQTRDNIGFGAQFNPKIRSGGHALAFYATLQIWLSCKKNLTKTVKNDKEQIGIMSHIKIKRNRLTGKKREVDIPIYWSTGIDDIGSCIEYLISKDHWKKVKGITAPEFDFTGSFEKLVEKIESENLEKKLKKLVSNVWKGIDDQCEIPRKKRYV